MLFHLNILHFDSHNTFWLSLVFCLFKFFLAYFISENKLFCLPSLLRHCLPRNHGFESQLLEGMIGFYGAPFLLMPNNRTFRNCESQLSYNINHLFVYAWINFSSVWSVYICFYKNMLVLRTEIKFCADNVCINNFLIQTQMISW